MQIPLLINLDMVGHPEDPANLMIIVEHDIRNHVRTNVAPSMAFANQMTEAAADYTTLKTTLGPIYSSDYMPFDTTATSASGRMKEPMRSSLSHSQRHYRQSRYGLLH